MIVDDDENILRLIALYLKKEGYTTLEYFDGKTALEAFGRETPDLVILDLMLPEMDGYEAVSYTHLLSIYH